VILTITAGCDIDISLTKRLIEEPRLPDHTLIKQQDQRTRPRGRPFAKGVSGNPAGRPRGCRDKVNRIAELLLEGEAEALTRKAVELALAGNPVALRLCLDRIAAPRRGRPVRFAMPPVSGAADLAGAMGAVAGAAAAGEITPAEAAQFARVVEAMVRAIETTDFDRRLRELERGKEP
jgi:hypothetical protein